MKTYPIILENAGPNWSAHAPDVPGVFGVGLTPEECEQDLRAGIETYLEYCRDNGIAVPEPAIKISYVQVAA